MNKIRNYRVGNSSEIELSVKVVTKEFIYDVIDELYEKFIHGRYNYILWEYKGNPISVKMANCHIIGCPSIDMQYVIAIFSGDQAEDPPPNNAIVYNADGSIH